MSDKNIRYVISGANLSVRSSQGDEAATAYIDGRAFSYRVKSAKGVPFPGAVEQIAPGAFRDSLASGQDVVATWNHSTEQIPLGRLCNKTLVLRDGPQGMDFTINLNPKVSTHSDIRELVRNNTIDQCSFAFTVDPNGDDWADYYDDEDRCHYQLRTVNSARLFDIALVMSPAYPVGTSATARNLRSLAYSFGPPAQEWDELRTQAESAIDNYHRQRAAELADEIRKGL